MLHLLPQSKQLAMEEYNDYKKAKQNLENKLEELESVMSQYPRNEMGLVLDGYKDEKYKKAKLEWAYQFKKLQEINRIASKMFKKQIQKEHEAKIAEINKKYHEKNKSL